MKTDNAVQIDETNRAALELITSAIKAKLNAVDGHKQAFFEEGTAAGFMLIELKSKLPHGTWIPWLKEHGINPRTAARWMAEAIDPEKAKIRQKRTRDNCRAAWGAKKEMEELQELYPQEDEFELEPSPLRIKLGIIVDNWRLVTPIQGLVALTLYNTYKPELVMSTKQAWHIDKAIAVLALNDLDEPN